MMTPALRWGGGGVRDYVSDTRKKGVTRNIRKSAKLVFKAPNSHYSTSSRYTKTLGRISRSFIIIQANQ
ncbi:hypothetical protein HanRHA438_Chr10g0457871 [Helianthus annuus]|nr:hypothetical protein HanRHA438_Chr10g0457871 [Helianthus annuus]